jgi:hypothetical protein
LLTLGAVVYRTLETVQSALVVTLFSLLIVLAVLLVRPAGVAARLAGAVQVGRIPESHRPAALPRRPGVRGRGWLGELAQSNCIRDKGYGMGG